MKRIAVLLAVMAMVFSLSGKAQAVPMYYTFFGDINTNIDDAGAIFTQLRDFAERTNTVTYTFILDFDADGTRTLNDGTVNIMADDADYDYFYADYFSGDALVQVEGGVMNDPPNIAERNYGFNTLDILYGGYLYGNSDDDRLTIHSISVDPSDWVVGTAVDGWNEAYDSTGALSLLTSELMLIAITPVSAAVPEPSTLLLLGSGLVGLFAFRRRSVA